MSSAVKYMQYIIGALMRYTSRSFHPDGQLKSIGSLSPSSFNQKQQHLLEEINGHVPFDKTLFAVLVLNDTFQPYFKKLIWDSPRNRSLRHWDISPGSIGFFKDNSTKSENVWKFPRTFNSEDLQRCYDRDVSFHTVCNHLSTFPLKISVLGRLQSFTCTVVELFCLRTGLNLYVF